jgi:DNA-binding NarL/FixJ family response regulator
MASGMQNDAVKPNPRCAPALAVATLVGDPGAHLPGGKSMDEQFSQMGIRERQIVELLLQGCDNSEIARDLNIAERTVKAYFNRMFLRFGIKGGIKRVKLATLIYRRQLWQERQASTQPANANTSSSNA